MAVPIPNVVGLVQMTCVGGAGGGGENVTPVGPELFALVGAADAWGAARMTTAATVERTIRATTNTLNTLFCLLLALMVLFWGSWTSH